MLQRVVRWLPTILLVAILSLTVSGQGLWVSYILPTCGSKDPVRFYVSTSGGFVGQMVVITVTSLQGLVQDPKGQEAAYRPTLAKGAVIQPGGMAQNITFDPRALPGKVEVRVTLPLGSRELRGVYFELESLCK